jgi:hypothetical protein
LFSCINWFYLLVLRFNHILCFCNSFLRRIQCNFSWCTSWLRVGFVKGRPTLLPTLFSTRSFFLPALLQTPTCNDSNIFSSIMWRHGCCKQTHKISSFTPLFFKSYVFVKFLNISLYLCTVHPMGMCEGGEWGGESAMLKYREQYRDSKWYKSETKDGWNLKFEKKTQKAPNISCSLNSQGLGCVLSE